MKTCPKCGRENPDEQDFCQCGEYLRWEPTQFVAAVEPTTLPQTPPPPGEPAVARTPAQTPAVPARSVPTRADPVRIALRLPDVAGAPGGEVALQVAAGGRATLLALVRNQSGIVDNYQLRIEGVPDGWWTITTPTVYLVPFGAGGTYEQEVEILIHPPRAPEAQARPWTFEVVAISAASETVVARAGATVVVEPYHELAAELRPERPRGRSKAKLSVAVVNLANAPAEVELSGVDSDGACRFDFASPRVTVRPGQQVEAPLVVRSPKQIWFGRPLDRRFEISARTVGADAVAVRHGAFVQRAWFPRWVPGLVPVALALGLLVWMLTPTTTKVPDLTKAANVNEARKMLEEEGLRLASAQPADKPLPGKRPGAIVDQSLPAGQEADKGTEVTVTTAVGSGKRTVPNVVGLTAAKADAKLRGAHLALVPPSDPKAKIASQIPTAGERVPEGTAVNVYPKPAGAGGGGAGAFVIPALAGQQAAAAAGLVSKAGLAPQVVPRFDTAAPGTVIGSDPAENTKLAKGTKVKVLVAAPMPLLTLDNGDDVLVFDVAAKKPVAVFGKDNKAQDEQPTWSADGARIAYRSGKGIVLADPSAPDQAPLALKSAADLHNPSFAPSKQRHVLAFIRRQGNDGDLCFASVGPATRRLTPSCLPDPRHDLSRQVSWSPDGKKVLVFALDRQKQGRFGLVRYATDRPFSPRRSDWRGGKFVTDVSESDHGVIAGAFSPDGEKLVLVANPGSTRFSPFVTRAGDYKLEQGTDLQVRACNVAWRPDSAELIVMQADDCGTARVGDLVRVDPSQPGQPKLVRRGAFATWQPKEAGG